MGMFEKIEVVTMLMVKLNFLIIRYSIPFSKMLYVKFTSNQMYVVNNNNFNKLLGLAIRMMSRADSSWSQTTREVSSVSEVYESESEYENDIDDIKYENQINFGPLNLTPIGVWQMYNQGRAGLTTLFNSAEEFARQL
ncbi:hypothetical protein CANTEDRAFT_135398 [Yamadazyma tenuis ATCC 10573]|nr:uncharacterized protein CANTEDRAFT_135398 [Yamadazyma tenuis ATCC 10573]EGV61442.1 hypothetical protein CANTEDRAFT_135398 [Yamadazyma tenuis ATCC 10573]